MEELNKILGNYCANCLHNPCDCKFNLHIVINSFCPECGEKGYKTDLTDNSYACKKCLTYWAK